MQEKKDTDAELNQIISAKYARWQAKKEKEEAEFRLLEEMRTILKSHGIQASEELLSILVTEDAAHTRATVHKFIPLFLGAVEDAVREELKGKTPEAGTFPSGIEIHS